MSSTVLVSYIYICIHTQIFVRQDIEFCKIMMKFNQKKL